MSDMKCLPTAQRLPPISPIIRLSLTAGHVDWNREEQEIVFILLPALKRSEFRSRGQEHASWLIVPFPVGS